MTMVIKRHFKTISVVGAAFQVVAAFAQPAIPAAPRSQAATVIPPMLLEEGVSAGVILQEQGVSAGYVLISAAGMKATYLINNDGFVVHHWKHEVATSKSAYLLPDGNLLRTVRKEAGDVGDAIQKLSWNGEVLWEYVTDQETQRIHHDIDPLPDGNILAVVWERVPKSEYVAAGRNPDTVPNGILWLDTVHEIKPTGKRGGEVVWRWSPWDHAVQNFDKTKANYGDPAAHPYRIDLNQLREESGRFNRLADWLHINSIQYNPEREEIMLSLQAMSEVWIVSKKTGKLVYRFGNPQRYGKGSDADRTLYNPHDANTIAAGLKGEGNIILFNNVSHVEPGKAPSSSVLEVKPPYTESGEWPAPDENGLFPSCEVVWEYTGLPDAGFYSPIFSSAQRLKSGGTLIGAGAPGKMIEVDVQEKRVWEYVHPRVTGKIKLKKLEKWNALPPPPANAFFRVYRYQPEYAAFSGKDLTPKFIMGNNGPVAGSTRSPAK
ncbi:aryl-sulfate sulfotransferase [Pontiellaceae bacterium B12227]|nr:aryl-sulfate sulfotransferase [Pontiellaceae bacterium B12227]